MVRDLQNEELRTLRWEVAILRTERESLIQVAADAIAAAGA